jgi:peptide/nickel transport system permease protein
MASETLSTVASTTLRLRVKSDGFWTRATKRFLRHRLAVAGLIMLALLALSAIFAPVISQHSAFELDLRNRAVPPNADHWLGTDRSGRDVWARVMLGGQVSLSVGIVAVGLSTVIGVVIGSVSGYFGKGIDQVLMRITDMVMSFPTLIIIIALVAILQPNIYNSMIAIGLLSWPGTARLVRSLFLTLREMDYVQAARCIGASSWRIIFAHILPNTVGPIMVAFTFAVGNAILLEAGLSFLGLGVQIPTPSWGNMLRDAQSLTTLEELPWMWIPPGLMIILSVLSVNFVGDGLRDALDPRMKL